jgi:hypothetical protein
MRQNKKRQRRVQIGLAIKEKTRKAEANSKLHIPDRNSHQTQKKQAEKPNKDSNHKINNNF